MVSRVRGTTKMSRSPHSGLAVDVGHTLTFDDEVDLRRVVEVGVRSPRATACARNDMVGNSGGDPVAGFTYERLYPS